MLYKYLTRCLIVDSDRVIDDAAILVRSGVVERVGSAEELAAVKPDRRVDLKSSILHPGFVNAHSHLELSFLHGLLKPKPGFTQWAVNLVKRRNETSQTQMNRSVKRAINRMLETGTTTVGDITFTGRVSRPILKSGIRAVVFHEMLGYRPRAAEERFEDFIGRINEAPSSPIVTNAVTPHAVYSTSQELIGKAARYARKKKIPITMHICETKEEVAFSRFGAGPLRDLLKRYNAYESGRYPKVGPALAVERVNGLDNMLVAHFNHPMRGDITRLKKAGSKVVICPNCGRWFGRGVSAPVYELMKRGVPIALGTDSLASNNDIDMAREARLFMNFFPDITIQKAFYLATEAGAFALDMPDKYGTLNAGAPFDAVRVSLNSAGKVNPFKAALSPKRKIKQVWVNGVSRHKNRRTVL